MFDVYRAFPEFDQFDDERCRGYVAYVWARHGAGLHVGAALLALGVVGAWIVVTPLAAFGVAPWLVGIARFVPVSQLQAEIASLGAAYLSIAMMALLARDWQYRRVLRKHLSGVRCSACDYSLLGARVIDGSVRCPECGRAFLIASRGLSERDFLADEGDAPAPSRED